MTTPWDPADGLPFPDPELHTAEIRLRPWRREDVPAIVEACADPSIAEFSPVIPFPYTAEDAIGWLESQEPARRVGAALDLAVVDAASGQTLGAIGLTGVSPLLRTANIGYWLAASARGHGHITSAVRLLAGWAFAELQLARLELTTDPDNLASQRVAERCGFRQEGRLRSHMLILHSGQRRDSLIYGLLAGELA